MRSDRSAFGMVIDKMFADQERRHEWLIRAGEQIRRMNDEEDKGQGDLAAPTVAGAPSGLSPSRSQAKPLIDYRKENAPTEKKIKESA
jgi:hypothetical protein